MGAVHSWRRRHTTLELAELSAGARHDRARGEGKAVHLGGRVATAEAHLSTVTALYAHATSTC
jgi:acyl-coenzyme A thioesterase PaaI-like protein